ncbi:MAG: hypothetical protein CM1200mP30_13220 [Pseudomonadota bacterium]|nr:MAG: hypothetical protein CM1200mP30_13220 [Pseudomonadota bacterium]
MTAYETNDYEPILQFKHFTVNKAMNETFRGVNIIFIVYSFTVDCCSGHSCAYSQYSGQLPHHLKLRSM